MRDDKGTHHRQEQIRRSLEAAQVTGGCLLIEFPEGGCDLVDPKCVDLLDDSIAATDLDGTRVEIPYSTIVGVTVDLLSPAP